MGRTRATQGRSVERTKARLWAQDFVSFGYRSQSRETMEYSARSECDGAFERRRETSPLPPRKPNSPVVKQDKYEQDMDQMKTAQGDLAVNMDQMETTQGDLAFMDTVDLIKQGQSAVATGSNNNNGEDKNGLEEKETTGAATPARLNLKYIYGMGSSHLLRHQARLLIPRRRTREDLACRRQIDCARGWPWGRHKAL